MKERNTNTTVTFASNSSNGVKASAVLPTCGFNIFLVRYGFSSRPYFLGLTYFIPPITPTYSCCYALHLVTLWWSPTSRCQLICDVTSVPAALLLQCGGPWPQLNWVCHSSSQYWRPRNPRRDADAENEIWSWSMYCCVPDFHYNKKLSLHSYS